MPFKGELFNDQQTAPAAATAYTIGSTTVVAAGNHVVLHCLRRSGGATITGVTSSAPGAVSSLDIAASELVPNWVHSVVSVYFPNGASASDTITITWSAGAGVFQSVIAHVYSGLASSGWKIATSTPATGFSATATTGSASATADGVAVGAFLGDTSGVTISSIAAGFTSRARENAANFGVMDLMDKAVSNGDSLTASITWSGTESFDALLVIYKSAPAVAQTFRSVRAFQEDSEPRAFQPQSFQRPDPIKAFQEENWSAVTGGGFGFQPNAFQRPDPTSAFQDSAFDDEGFQGAGETFQDNAYQPDAFQIDEPLAATAAVPGRPRPPVSTRNARRAAYTARARHRETATILRAPVVPAAPRPAIVEQRPQSRVVRARGTRHKPLILRAPLTTQRPRPPVVRAARSRPQLRTRGWDARAARLTRAPSTTTATPLVVKHIVVRTRTLARPLLARVLHRQAKLARGHPTTPAAVVVPHVLVTKRRLKPRKRRPIIVRPPAAAARRAVPLVFRRRRVVRRRPHPLILRSLLSSPRRPTPIIVRRKLRVRRSRPSILLRPRVSAVVAAIAPRAPYVYTTTVSKLARLRARKPLRLRARSVTTATPLVVPRVIVHTQTARRSALVRANAVRPLLLKPRPPVTVVTPRVPQPLIVKHRQLLARARRRKLILRAPLTTLPARPLVRTQTLRRPELARLRRRKPQILRGVSTTTATPTIVRRIVVRPTTLARPKRFRLLHHKPQLTRSPQPAVFPRPVPPPLLARRTAWRPTRYRLAHDQPRIIRAPRFATATPLVRKRLVLATQTRNRTFVVWRHRHRDVAFVTNPGLFKGIILTQPGQALISDLLRFDTAIRDLPMTGASVTDTGLKDVAVVDRQLRAIGISDDAADLSISDRPGG